ncbi:MAG: tRNA pseudouridine synthase tRNA pseudouridine55 synthase [Candidatus Parcubacteria bacterium]|jgi:tRNA pseudouridine55 synthase
MQRYAVIEKHVGETPLEAIEVWRVRTGIAQSVPLAYAGRLDPMASGKLLVLMGDECKRQTAYHGFDKEYRVEVLLGARTDTGDILGMAELAPPHPPMTNQTIKDAVRGLLGTHTFKYPRFSARTVRGIPLHELTLKGEIADADIPTYQGIVKRISCNIIREVSAKDVHAYIQERIRRIPIVTDPRKHLGADFRRGIIMPRWDELLLAHTEPFTIVTIVATVSSGTYMRTLAEALGERLGSFGLAYSIHRTRIGTYRKLPFGYGLWTRWFT